MLVRNGHADFNYSDGEKTEKIIASIIDAAQVRSTSSEELRAAICDWPTEYHLSAQRANILRPFQLKPGMSILELGAGMGAITRFLGESGAQVVAVEGSFHRASVARSRTADLENVTVVCDNIMNLEFESAKFDLVLIIGVLEYAPRFISGLSPAEELLRKARMFAKDQGFVVIAIENALGIKYLAGAGEDHTGIPFQSIEDRYGDGGPRTYGHSALCSLAESAGLHQQHTLIAHPDYKLATQVVDIDRISTTTASISRLLRYARSFDGLAPVRRTFNEMLALRHFDRNGLLGEVANSFILITSPQGNPQDCLTSGEAAWLFSSDRHLGFQTSTTLRITPDGGTEVFKRLLYDLTRPISDLTWKLQPPAQFREGPLLSERLVDAYFSSPSGNWKLLTEIFGSYTQFLASAQRSDGTLPPEMFDALPRNIVCGNDGWHLIDYEWESRIPIEVRFIAYRAARSTLDELSQIPASSTLSSLFPTRIAALKNLLAAANFPINDDLIRRFSEIDAKMIAPIVGRPSHDFEFLVSAAELGAKPGATPPDEQMAMRLRHAEQGINELGHEKNELLTSLQISKRKLDDCSDALIFREKALAMTEEALHATKRALAETDAQLAEALKSAAANRSTHNVLIGKILTAGGYDSTLPGIDPVGLVTGLSDDVSRFRDKLQSIQSEISAINVIGRDRTTDLYRQLNKLFSTIPDSALNDSARATRARLAELANMHFDPNGYDISGHLGYVLHALYAAVDATTAMSNHIANVDGRLNERDRIIGEQQFALATLPVRIARYLIRLLRQAAPVGSRRGAMIDWIASRIDGRPRRRAIIHQHGKNLLSDSTPEPVVEPIPPESWRSATTASDSALSGLIARTKETTAPADGPLISVILPVYRIPPRVLARTIGCLVAQSYVRWEACITFADPDGISNNTLLNAWAAREPRLKIKILERNLGISGNSNAALEMVSGEWVALLDHDDELPPDALARLIDAAINRPNIDLWYTDKDCIDDSTGLRLNPLVKPDWSPEMMYSVNYLTHLNLLRTEVLRKIGGWRRETDGAQDWDLFLRMATAGRGVARVTGIAYHWRIIAGSTSTGVGAKPYVLSAQLRTIEDQVQRSGFRAKVRMNAECGFHIQWDVPQHAQVLVVMVVPGDTSPNVMAPNLINTLRSGSTRLRARYALCAKTALPAPAWMTTHTHLDGPLAALKQVALSAQENWIVLCSPSILSATPDWVDDLVGWLCQDPAIAFSTPLIVNEAGSVVESGRVVDDQGRGHPLFRGAALRSWGVFGGPLWHRNVRAGAPWCLAFRREALARALSRHEVRSDDSDWTTNVCLDAINNRDRGVVVPPIRITIDDAGIPPPPPFDPSLANDPYFHPALYSATEPRLAP